MSYKAVSGPLKRAFLSLSELAACKTLGIDADFVCDLVATALIVAGTAALSADAHLSREGCERKKDAIEQPPARP